MPACWASNEKGCSGAYVLPLAAAGVEVPWIGSNRLQSPSCRRLPRGTTSRRRRGARTRPAPLARCLRPATCSHVTMPTIRSCVVCVLSFGVRPGVGRQHAGGQTGRSPSNAAAVAALSRARRHRALSRHLVRHARWRHHSKSRRRRTSARCWTASCRWPRRRPRYGQAPFSTHPLVDPAPSCTRWLARGIPAPTADAHVTSPCACAGW
jgi:hypothetical protein